MIYIVMKYFFLNTSSILDSQYKNIFDTNNAILSTLKDILKTQINGKESSSDNSNQSN